MAAAAAAIPLTMLTGCFLNAFEALQNIDSPSLEPRVEIQVVINGSRGDDRINVYADDHGPLARAMAAPLGIQNPVFAGTSVGFTEIRDRDRDRIITRTDGRWSIRIDVPAVKDVASAHGVDKFRLAVCHPATRVRILNPPPNEGEVLCDTFGRAWEITRNDFIQPMTFELIPSEGAWKAFLAGIAVWYGILGVVFVVVGRVLRRDLPRTGAKVVPIALLFGILGCLLGMLFTSGFAAFGGPADNLALSRDYAFGDWLLAVLAPSAGAFAPWVVLGLTLVWGRPWRKGKGTKRGGPGSLEARPPLPPG